jgi:hypothetical protein
VPNLRVTIRSCCIAVSRTVEALLGRDAVPCWLRGSAASAAATSPLRPEMEVRRSEVVVVEASGRRDGADPA